MNRETQHIVSLASFPQQQQELDFDNGLRLSRSLSIEAAQNPSIEEIELE